MSSSSPLHIVEVVESAAADRDPPSRPIAWPGVAHLVRTFGEASVVAAVFALVYGGADAIARLHRFRVDLSIAADAAVPFVPEATLIYSSLYVMFAVAPFVLRTAAGVRMLARAIVVQILIAAPFFLALPMPQTESPAGLGRFASAFQIADRINLDHNQFPSLHASFAFTTATVLARRVGVAGGVLFAGWSLAIALSTLLTKQHVIVDLAGALALSAVSLRLVPGEKARRT